MVVACSSTTTYWFAYVTKETYPKCTVWPEFWQRIK